MLQNVTESYRSYQKLQVEIPFDEKIFKKLGWLWRSYKVLLHQNFGKETKKRRVDSHELARREEKNVYLCYYDWIKPRRHDGVVSEGKAMGLSYTSAGSGALVGLLSKEAAGTAWEMMLEWM